MDSWQPKRKKTYPHFDRLISDETISKIVTDPIRVAENKFFPFILFVKKYKPYDKKTPRALRDIKDRKIRYACRKDAYIFERYRGLLVPCYEAALAAAGIVDVPIAYRRLKTDKGRGKSSVEFAKDAMDVICTMRPCYAVTLDISKYFENLDHARIYSLWARLLGRKTLPKDHLAVFKAITRYAEVDRDAAYERLGFIGPLKGKSRKGFLVKKNEIPHQICTPKQFREMIFGEAAGYTKLVVQNKKPFGIPQGAPISDLIANFYLIDFDREVQSYVKTLDGYYRRYCDDIILVLPDNREAVDVCLEFVSTALKKAGDHLEIKPKKTRIHRFGTKTVDCIFAHEGKKPPFEYLGFQFDGAHARLRSGTMSNFYRKVTFAVRSEAKHLIARYPDKTPKEIYSTINLSRLYEKFGRKRGFENFAKDVKKWNFWSYVTRASGAMKPYGALLHRQMRGYKAFVRSNLLREISRAYASRNRT